MSNLSQRATGIQYELQSDDQLCFLHIAKAAGTTLTYFLRNQFNFRDICPAAYWEEAIKIPRETLAQFKLLMGHLPYFIYRLLPKKPAYMTMLRDPVERILSTYEFHRWFFDADMDVHSDPDILRQYEIQKRSVSQGLEQFLANDSPIIDRITNGQTKQIAWDNPEMPDLSDPALLDLAKEHLDECAFVGLTEQFQESLLLLSYTFGWRPILENLKLNVTPNRRRRKDISGRIIDRIVEMNQLDIELYRYAQQLFQARFSQMMREMTEKHYEQRYAERRPARWPAAHFGFDQTTSGIGWHMWEPNSAGSGHRWTGPGTVSTLDLPLTTDRDLQVEFRVAGAAAPDILDSLILHVNGHQLATRRRQDECGVTTFQAIVPESILNNGKPFTRFKFTVNRTVSAKTIDPATTDDRHVGVAFQWLEVFPTPATDVLTIQSHSPAENDQESIGQPHSVDEGQALANVHFDDGFHQDEGGWRWTQQRARGFLPPVSKPALLTFRLTCAPAEYYPQFPFEVNLYLDQKLTQRVVFDQSGQTHTVELYLGSDNGGGLLQLESTSAFTPFLQGISKDRRTLSVQLSNLEIRSLA